MSELIERMARALCSARGEDPDRPFIDRHGVTQDFPWWTELVDDARAALLAAREPTEGMVATVMLAAPTPYERDRAVAAITRDWRAMIDEGLKQ